MKAGKKRKSIFSGIQGATFHDHLERARKTAMRPMGATPKSHLRNVQRKHC